MNSIVLSAGFASASNHTASHFHDSHQLLYITRGQAQITVSGREYTAKPGTLVLISRFETHSVRITTPDYCRYSVQIAPLVNAYGKMIGYGPLSVLMNRPAHFQHAVDMSGCPALEPLLREMEAEYAARSPLHQNMLDLKFLQLLLYLFRAHPELATQSDAALGLVQQVQAYLEINYPARLTLEELANTFHLSPSHLSHQFKRIAGISVMGYLQACRLAAAKQQLAQTDLAICHVIDACGYSDSSNFSRAFRTATGLTPSQFRKQYR